MTKIPQRLQNDQNAMETTKMKKKKTKQNKTQQKQNTTKTKTLKIHYKNKILKISKMIEVSSKQSKVLKL